jgi:hypothetical protein
MSATCADVHLRAAFPPSASGRYISGHNASLPAIAAILLERQGAGYPIPRHILPKWLPRLLGPYADKSETYRPIAGNIELRWRGDNRRNRNELGIRNRPLAESMTDASRQLVETGQ